MSTVFQDIRYCMRSLARSHAFTVLVLAILSLGIGAVTALFSVCDAAILRPLPYPDSTTLVGIDSTRTGRTSGTASWLEFQEWRLASSSFSEIGGYMQTEMNAKVGSRPQRMAVTLITPNVFHLLKTNLVGHPPAAEDGGVGRLKSVVLSHGVWEQQFAGSSEILGKPITLDQQEYIVVGIAPSGFEFPIRSHTNVWATFDQSTDMFKTRGMHFISAIARLRQGVSLQQAQSDMRAVAQEMHQKYPADSRGRGIAVQSLQGAWLGKYKTQLWLLFGAVVLVMLVACANVATLLLARGSVRSYEAAIRVAVGASPARLLRLFLTESLLLASAAGVGGSVLGWLLLKAMRSALANYFPGQEIGFLNLHLIVVVFGAMMVTVIVAGLIPAWHVIRGSHSRLRESGLASLGPREQHLRSALVISEIAAAVMLVAAAGVLIRTMWTLQHVPLGLTVERVLSMKVAPAGDKSDVTSLFYAPLLRELRDVPGIAAVGLINNLPLAGPGMNSTFLIPGQAGFSADRKPEAEIRVISNGYHAVMGIPLLRGRDFSNADIAGSQPVAIINDIAADRYFKNRDPVGSQLQIDEASPKLTIAGVVKSTRQRAVGDDFHPEIDLVYAQLTADDLISQLSLQREMYLVVRSALPEDQLIARIRASVDSVNPGATVYDAQTMKEVVAESLRSENFAMHLFIAFGCLTVVLAGAGVYGITAYMVERRTHEIGLRMALGATRGNILRIILMHSLFLTSLGLGIGIAGFLVVGKTLSGLVYGSSYLDFPIIILTSLTLAGISLVTSCLPAYRAITISPGRALRES